MSGPSISPNSLWISVNGFGRIGRSVVRQALERGERIVSINDPTMTAEDIAYALRYDSVHGPFLADIKISPDEKNMYVKVA